MKYSLRKISIIAIPALLFVSGIVLSSCAHKHEFTSVVTDPTCTEKGYTTYTCECGEDTYVDNYVEALGHDYGSWSIKEKPTLETEGKLEKVCSHDVTHVENFTLPKLNEEEYEYELISNYTCTTDGEALYTYLKDSQTFEFNVVLKAHHNFSEEYESSSGSHYFICECGEKSNQEAHTYVDGVCSVCNHIENRNFFVFELKDDGTYKVSFSEIYGAIIRMSEVTIPSTYNGKAVTELDLGEYVPYSLYIPNSITTLRLNYYIYSSNSIGYNCYYNGTIESWCNVYLDVVGSDYNYELSSEYYNMISLYFLNENGEYYMPEELIVPEGVETIGDYQFAVCNKVKNISLPNSIKKVGTQALPINENIKLYEFDEGYYLGNSQNKKLYLVKAKYQNGDKYVIDSATRVIGSGAFAATSSANQLTSLEIHGNVCSFQANAFGYTQSYNLNLVSIKDIYYKADWVSWLQINFDNMSANPMINANNFYMMKSGESWYSLIDEIEIPNGTTEIENYSFVGFKNVKKLVLPESINKIGLHSFYLMGGLTAVNYLGTIESWCKIEFANEYSNPMVNSNALFYMVSYDKVWEAVTEIVIPNTITKLNSYVFSSFRNIEKIIIPDSVTEIDNYAFANSVLSNKVYTVYENGLYLGTTDNPYYTFISVYQTNNEAATSIVVHEDTKVIGKQAFAGNSILESITLPSGLLIISDTAFTSCTNLKSITIPDTVTSIGNYAFANCNKITEMIIPDSVVSLGKQVFDYTGLITLKIGKGLKEISENSFGRIYTGNGYTGGLETIEVSEENPYFTSSNGKNVIVDINEKKLILACTNSRIPNDVVIIGSYSFNGVDIKDLVIPQSVKIFENSAFINSAVTNVCYAGTIESWCDIIFEDAYSNPLMCSGVLQIFNSKDNWYEEVLNIVIPETVLEIGDYQFVRLENVKSITLHENIIYIGEGAFGSCSSIKEFTWPSKVKEIKMSALSGLISLESLIIPEGVEYFGLSSLEGLYNLEELVIPNSLKENYCSLMNIDVDDKHIGKVYYNGTIEEWLNIKHIGGSPMSVAKEMYFKNQNGEYYKLTNLELDSSLTSINEFVFAGFNFTTVKIPSSIETIKTGAFLLADIEKLYIHKGIKTIESNAFESCKINNVYFEGTLEDWFNLDISKEGSNPLENGGTLFLLDEDKVWREATTIKIPNSVTVLTNGYLSGFDNIEKLYIPKTITKVEGDIYEKDKAIKEIYFEGTLEDWCKIEFCNYYANPMYHAEKIYMLNSQGEYYGVTEIVIPSTITTINNFQFLGFKNVTKVIIHNNINYIGYNAFGLCSSIESITLPFLGSSSNASSTIEYVISNIDALKEVTINNGTSIPDYAFQGCYNLSVITLPSTLTSIGNNAFEGCSSLISFVIPDSVTHIGEYAFSNCVSLATVTLPSNLETIESGLFNYCYSLTELVIPNSVTTIESEFLYECNSIEYLSIPFIDEYFEYTSNYYTVSQLSYLFYYSSYNDYVPYTLAEVEVTGGSELPHNAFKGLSNLEKVTLSNSITNIGDFAFSRCSSLSEVTLGNKVETLGSDAFYGCESLTSVTLPNTLKTIGNYAFSNCLSLSSITIPNSVQSIGKGAFYSCNLVELTIPNSVTYIGEGALTACDSITKLTIPFVGEYADGSGETTIYHLFYVYESRMPQSLTTIVVTGGTSIPYGAFDGCSYITSVTLSEKITTIEDYAFLNCSSLKTIKISSKTTSIGNQAFVNCYQLQSITLPNTLTSIGKEAFFNCVTLKTIDIPSSVTYIGTGALSGCYALEEIVIPFIGDSNKSDEEVPLYPLGHLFYSNGGYLGNYITVSQQFVGDSYGYETHTYYFPANLRKVTVLSGYIHSSAFENCTMIEEIVLGEGITDIFSYAFSYCTSLKTISFPSTLVDIGDYAFYSCSSLTTVDYAGTKDQYNSISIGSSNSYLNNAEKIYRLDIPTTGYCLVINGTKYIQLTKNTTYTGSGEEWSAMGVVLKTGDVLTMYNANVSEHFFIKKVDIYSLGYNNNYWTVSTTGVTCNADGTFNIYCKLIPNNDNVYFGKA